MSDPTTDLSPDLTAPPRKPWLTWLLLALFVLAIIGWLAGPSLKAAARQFFVKRCAAIAEKHMAAENWPAAGEAIADARRWAPDEPAVLRLVADFLVKTRADPTGLIYTLRRLEESGQATTEDRVHMGQAFLGQNNIAAARATLARISEAERAERLPLELQAAILRHEGRLQEAETVLRRALLLAPDDPAARLRLAILDHQAAFAEMRERARRTMWDLAQGRDDTALAAIEFLAANPELLSREAGELLRLIDAHPAPTAGARLRVVSALLRLRPETRTELVDAEAARYGNKPPSELPELLNWLNQEREHERVLTLLPEALAFKSAPLLQARLEALGRLDRWAEVEQILRKPGLPVSMAFISIWMADAYRHLDQDAARARQQLITAYEASGRGKEGMAALRAAQLAEELGLWDIASRCYAGLAQAQPQAEIPMLEKVREMSLRDRDTRALVQTARRLVELRPTNPAYADSLLYLRLVTGEDLELILNEVRERPSANHRAPEALFKALAAYRIGDIQTMREQLPLIADPTTLPAGQRAVYAGLLSTSGKVGPAFVFAEKVPDVLLLEEELRFLRRAR